MSALATSTSSLLAARSRRLDYRTQALAVSRVQGGRSTSQDIETGPGRFKLRDPRIHLRKALVDDAAHVQAGWVAGIGDVEDLADLVEREAGRLRVADEREPLDHARVVVAVPGRRAGGVGEQPLGLPEAYRLRRNAGPGDDLPYPYRTTS